jgi:hypothetical protein
MASVLPAASVGETAATTTAASATTGQALKYKKPRRGRIPRGFVYSNDGGKPLSLTQRHFGAVARSNLQKLQVLQFFLAFEFAQVYNCKSYLQK